MSPTGQTWPQKLACLPANRMAQVCGLPDPDIATCMPSFLLSCTKVGSRPKWACQLSARRPIASILLSRVLSTPTNILTPLPPPPAPPVRLRGQSWGSTTIQARDPPPGALRGCRGAYIVCNVREVYYCIRDQVNSVTYEQRLPTYLYL